MKIFQSISHLVLFYFFMTDVVNLQQSFVLMATWDCTRKVITTTTPKTPTYACITDTN